MKNNKKTKIIATIGPASDSPEKIRQLIDSGVDIFRFNTKHSTTEWHNERIKRVQKEAKKAKKIIGIMVDLQGSEVRIETACKRDISVRKNDIIFIGDSFSEKTEMRISDNSIFPKLKIGDKVLIDDGLIHLKVINKKESVITAKVIDGGVIRNRKSINFPGIDINLSSLIKRDIDSLDSANKNNVVFIALSFISSADDIRMLKDEIKKREMNAFVVAKIENQSAINNINEIISESDVVMIARGDLGIEIPIEKLAFWQKEIIKRCRKERTPVIVATQMLHSMVNNPRPTRAESTDVANSVLDGTDAVMLSEETAIGKYPIKSVIEMSKILEFNERNTHFVDIADIEFNSTEFVIGAITRELREEKKLSKLKIKTAIVFSEKGYTARVVSAFRPKIVISAITESKQIAEFLTICYGVNSYHSQINFKNLKVPDIIKRDLFDRGILSPNDNVAIFHGRYEKNPELISLFSLTKV